MNDFIKMFRKVNGFKVLKEYVKNHMLLYSLNLSILLGYDKKSLEILRLAVNNKKMKRLKKKYKSYVENCSIDTTGTKTIDEKRKVWICWFQGIENAPDIVKRCYESVKQNIVDRDVILITENNYKDYVSFPDYIVEKVNKNIISKTHLSDLLRLELLKRYGGTWIDATVLLTGKLPQYMLDSELFLFQNLKPGLDGHCIAISNWFITSEKNNNIISCTLDMLYDYWKRKNYLEDYFIVHLFFQIAIEKYPDIWKKVVPFSNSTPHILLLRLFEKYNHQIWTAIDGQTHIHKLTYKFEQMDMTNMSGTYYKEIIGIK